LGFRQYRALLLVATAVLALFVASPALEQLVVFPQTTVFSEFSLFGQYNNATYPSNITAGQTYRFYLDVTNHLGSCAYYVVEPKFRSENQSAPDSFNHTSSSLPSLTDITIFAADNQTCQIPVDVSLQFSVNQINSAELDVQSVTINGATISDSTTITWNTAKDGFFGNLFFELWLYNDTTNTLQYHQRFVSLWLRMNP
jgi:hypothetical protein